MKKTALTIAACMLVVGLFAGCSSSSTNSGKASSATSSVQQSEKFNLGNLSFQGIDGETYSDIFKNNKMTMVNIMATWCSPCVKELPELQQLYANLQGRNIGLVAVVLDTAEGGKINQQAIEEAKVLQSQAGISFPMLIPDSSGLDGFMATVQVVPTTIFVDQNGTIVSAVTGSKNYQAWLNVVGEMESKLG